MKLPNKIRSIRIYLLGALICLAVYINGQTHCDSLNNIVKNYLNTPEDKNMNKVFISDGQIYQAFINEEEFAEWETTLYGGSKYRIAASAGTDDNYLIIEILDENRNVLFSNSNHNNSTHWDFIVENTIDCKIVTKLDLNKKLSGCTLMMIGFEKSN